MAMIQDGFPTRKARKPRPVAGTYVYPLIDAIDQLLEEKAYAQSDGLHDPLNPEPGHSREKARFWRGLNRQMGVWGGAPPVIAEELRVRCREVAP